MKRLVIFCDGTWNGVSAKQETNVLLAAQSVLPHDKIGVEQITFYDEGVGTSLNRNSWLAAAFGWGLLDKIAAAYRFLVFNYVPGDEIFIFGFSRGAFTARSLAGLIRKCGIVSKANTKDIAIIFKFYKDSKSKPDSDIAQEFRMKYSPEVLLKEIDRVWRKKNGVSVEVADKLPLLNVKYLGVWDTVGALGIPNYLFVSQLFGTAKKYQFHDTDLSSTIHSARHAVAVDERRLSFAPSLWTNSSASDSVNFEQLWFPGDHGSVGGGGDIVGLSHSALVWILRGAVNQGLEIEKNKISDWQQKIDHLAPLVNVSKPPSLFSRLLYRRRDREGPQIVADLAKITLLRLEYEAKSKKMPLYRPKTLKLIHRNEVNYRRQMKQSRPNKTK